VAATSDCDGNRDARHDNADGLDCDRRSVDAYDERVVEHACSREHVDVKSIDVFIRQRIGVLIGDYRSEFFIRRLFCVVDFDDSDNIWHNGSVIGICHYYSDDIWRNDAVLWRRDVVFVWHLGCHRQYQQFDKQLE
jgi:hypothetical protein